MSGSSPAETAASAILETPGDHAAEAVQRRTSSPYWYVCEMALHRRPWADKTAKPAVFGRRLKAAVSGPRKLNRKIIQGTHHYHLIHLACIERETVPHQLGFTKRLLVAPRRIADLAVGAADDVVGREPLEWAIRRLPGLLHARHVDAVPGNSG